MNPELANPGSVLRRVGAYFDFATRMIDLVEAEVADGRLEAARALIYRAIDQLDSAAGVIWEFERYGREREPGSDGGGVAGADRGGAAKD